MENKRPDVPEVIKNMTSSAVGRLTKYLTGIIGKSPLPPSALDYYHTHMNPNYDTSTNIALFKEGLFEPPGCLTCGRYPGKDSYGKFKTFCTMACYSEHKKNNYNANSVEVHVGDVTYHSIDEAMKETGLSRYKILQANKKYMSDRLKVQYGDHFTKEYFLGLKDITNGMLELHAKVNETYYLKYEILSLFMNAYDISAVFDQNKVHLDMSSLKFPDDGSDIFLSNIEHQHALKYTLARWGFKRKHEEVCFVCGLPALPGNKLTHAHRIPFAKGVYKFRLRPEYLDRPSNIVSAHARKCNDVAELSDIEIFEHVKDLL